MLMRMLLGLCIISSAEFELQPELNSVFFGTVAQLSPEEKDNKQSTGITGYNYNLHGFRLVWRWSIFKFDIGYKARILRQFSSIIADLTDQASKKTKKPETSDLETYKRIASPGQEFYHVYLKIGSMATVFFGLLNPAHLPSGTLVETFNYGTNNIYRPMQAGSITDQPIKVFMITFLASHPILDSVSLLYNIPHLYNIIGRFATFSQISETIQAPTEETKNGKKIAETKQQHKIQTSLMAKKNNPFTYTDYLHLCTLIFRTIFDNSIGTSIYKMFLSTDISRITFSFTQKIDEPGSLLSEFSVGLSQSQGHVQLSRGRLSFMTVFSTIHNMPKLSDDPISDKATKEFTENRIKSFQKNLYIISTIIYYIPMNLAHSLYIGCSLSMNIKRNKPLFADNSLNISKHVMSFHILFGICQNKDAITKEIILKR